MDETWLLLALIIGLALVVVVRLLCVLVLDDKGKPRR
jgi:hypothetical protein